MSRRIIVDSSRVESCRVASVGGAFGPVQDCKSLWRRIASRRRRCSPSARSANLTRCVHQIEMNGCLDSKYLCFCALDSWQTPANQMDGFVMPTRSPLRRASPCPLSCRYKTKKTPFRRDSHQPRYRHGVWRHKVHDTSRVRADTGGSYRQAIFTGAAALSQHGVE